VQVGWAEVPGLVGVEVEPELAEVAKEAIVQQRDAPPAGGSRWYWLLVLPLHGVRRLA
jgi:hypothetical protein